MMEKKLLYVITTGNLGGAQTHLYDLISCLPDLNEVHVVMGHKGWLWERLAEKNIMLHQITELVQPVSIIEDMKAMWKIKELIQVIQPNLVHCHSSKAGFIGRIAAHFAAVPVIHTVHGWSFTDGISQKKQMVYRLLERIVARWTDRFICVSEYDRQLGIKFIPEHKDKMVTIHNGVRPLATEESYGSVCLESSGVVRLVMVARFSKQKDQALLVQAIAMLRQENIPIIVNFIGEGPDFTAVKELAKKLHVMDCVHFLGARDDVTYILGKNDVFVLTSNWEGFPISILEAMRQGLPVIASDVGGVSEAVFDRQNGFLIPRGDLPTLVASLREICINSEMRLDMGQHGKRIYEKNFTLSFMVEKIVHVYDQVLAKS